MQFGFAHSYDNQSIITSFRTIKVDTTNSPVQKMASKPEISAKKTAKRSRLSIKEKYDLIQDHKRQKSVDELSKTYNCGTTTVYAILKQEKEVVSAFLSSKNTGLKAKSRAPKFEEVDEKVYSWLCQALAKKLPVSGSLLQEKAKEIATELNQLEFKASNGWLEKFKSRHNLTFANICGESNDVEQTPVNDFREKLPEIIAGYDSKDIANCDETGLFFRSIPKKTLYPKGEKCFGGKHSKERLTVLLCCFGDGKFEKPLVIGKAENPRCFKNIRKENLPVVWKANKKAWMTSSIMEEWLIQLNRKMVIQKRNILLFLDNATSHPNLKLSNVKLVFLPPNTTSETQPLDRGIINSFKVHYRSRMLKRFICKMDSVSNVSELIKSVSCLDAIYWIKEAVDKMPNTVVPNCFRKAGFNFNQETLDDDDEENLPLSDLRALLEQIQIGNQQENFDMTVEEFIGFDDDVLTEADNQFELGTSNETEVDNLSDNDDDEIDFETPITHTEALMILDRIKAYACKEGLSSLLTKTAECANLIQDNVCTKKTKQTAIVDYFKKQ